MKTRTAVVAIALLGLAGFGSAGERNAATSTESNDILLELARGAWELDQLMDQSGAAGDRQSKAVVRVLSRMRDAIPTPTDDAALGSHPLIDVSLAAFRQDIIRARENAARKPPNYFWAGSVSGACVHCHGGEL